MSTGTDSAASSVSLVPKPASALKDVRLIYTRLETDSDYHLVLSDGAHTMIVEIPYPDCAQGSAWSYFISRARANVDANTSGSRSI